MEKGSSGAVDAETVRGGRARGTGTREVGEPFVGHVHAGALAHQPPGHPERTEGEQVAAGGGVGDDDALAGARVGHYVFADHVTCADRVDSGWIHGLSGSARHGLGQAAGGAAGCVELAHVVGFHDVDVEAGEEPRCLGDQAPRDRDAERGIGCHHRRHPGGGALDGLEGCLRKPGGAHEQCAPERGGHLCGARSTFIAGEIDHHVGLAGLDLQLVVTVDRLDDVASALRRNARRDALAHASHRAMEDNPERRNGICGGSDGCVLHGAHVRILRNGRAICS